MEFNNMLRDPDEKNQPSVFHFEVYPGQNDICSWDSNIQEPKYLNSSSQLENAPMFSNFIPSEQVPLPVAPQVPSSFSFGTSSDINSLSGQFPLQITNYGISDRRFRFVLGKRKADSPPEQPYKQHITEEKMAEHMSKLHISSETATSPLEPESVKNKRLYMCEEMRKLQTEPLLPASLVEKINRPCTALVLWQPPTKVLPGLSSQPDGTTCVKKEKNKNEDDPLTNGVLESVEMDNEFGGIMDLDS